MDDQIYRKKKDKKNFYYGNGISTTFYVKKLYFHLWTELRNSPFKYRIIDFYKDTFIERQTNRKVEYENIDKLKDMDIIL